MVGILLRFYYQFIDWSFNGDEINLGLDILDSNFQNLLQPFKSKQSAPPLFLIVEKVLLFFSRPYISLKILSFIFSCGSLILFSRLLKNNFKGILCYLLLAAFCFSPFIIGNSLKLKQYSADLFFGLIAINFFLKKKHSLLTFIFFCLFCLISNVGSFFCAAFSIYFVLKNFLNTQKLYFISTLKIIAPFILAPIPYIIYFIYFMAQPGAGNTKAYMTNYWQDSFLPLNLEIFEWIALQGNAISYFFFSSYTFLQFPLLLIFIIGLINLFKKDFLNLNKNLNKIFFIYIMAIFIQLILGALHLYPFSDRLFLWIAPSVFLILGFGINEMQVWSEKYITNKTASYFLYFPLLVAIILFSAYINPKSNDVISLNSEVNSLSHSEKIYLTPKAKNLIKDWLNMTGYRNQNIENLKNFSNFEKGIENSGDILIAQQSIKFGHKNRKSQPESIICELLQLDKIELVQRVNGYVVYKIK